MCMIVDANLCSVVFKNYKNTAYAKLNEAIFFKGLKIVFGGKLTKEYEVAKMLGIVQELNRSGKAYRISDDAINAQLAIIQNNCTSDDEHVIALARAARQHVHLLCSNDKALQTDFKNKTLIDSPRGTIYSPTRHKQSLANC
jgi:chaperonin GroEL (HSP60 family)